MQIEMDFQVILAANLKRIRASLGYTQVALAKKARISETAMKKIETQTMWPSPFTLKKLIRALKCTPSDLFQNVIK